MVIPNSSSFITTLKECELFYIQDNKFCELINYLTGASSASSKMSVINHFLLSDVNECALSRVNKVKDYNLNALPTMPSNTLALTNLDDNDYNPSSNSLAPTLIVYAAVATIIFYSRFLACQYVVIPKMVIPLCNRIWRGKQEDISNNTSLSEDIPLTENVLAIELAGNNDNLNLSLDIAK